ncbi:hypothetical protein EJ04DRAFT_565763 [Polyplosphaeria fusca]|uniref:Uncharacterized protein n=1 Tax=Polyplosphaeria fusca TaxID=682080 RepID=A0A9P4QWP2_9PLEO|nr:hypothetical protein EJ04DRAFT_565763 [Polyplosphaeria fusca]
MGVVTGGFKSNILPFITEQYKDTKPLMGSLAMIYSEHFVAFWLTYTLSTICYLLCPAVLLYFKKTYKLSPPTDSVIGKASKLIRLAFKGRWSWNPSPL